MNSCISGYSIMNNNPKIILSSYEIPIPRKNFEISEKILKVENVGTILNVANDCNKTEMHDKMYEKLGIKYVFLGINDELNYPPPEQFLDQVLEIFNEQHDKEKAFLVNCVSGINRSALAIAGILWKINKWSTPVKMIEHMRDIQIRDRGLWLLNNETFIEYLLQWCETNKN